MCHDIGVQVNRNSIEGHAQRPQQCQQEDQSAPPGGGNPVQTPGVGLDASMDSTMRRGRCVRGGKPNSSMAQPRYPQFSHPTDCNVARLDSAHGRGAALLQMLTQTLGIEFEELRHAWGINTAGQSRSVHQAHYCRLQKLARSIEKQSTMELLVQSEQTERKEAATREELQRVNEQLEAETAAMEKRIAAMSELVHGNSGKEAAAATLQDLVAEMRSAMEQGDLAGAVDVANHVCPVEKLNYSQWVMQLSILDVWFQQVFTHFREIEQRLEEREREASSRAFAHLPGGTAEPRRALLALR